MRAGTAEAFSARAEAPRRVPPEAHLAGPSGLAGVLRSGRFQVTGRVYFNPLKAFIREPEIPEEDTPLLYAQTDISGRDGFTYPDDVSHR